MLVKNAQSSSESFLQLKHTLSRPGRTKWFTGLLILLAVITGTHLFSVYYGMYLHKTGQSNTISGWVWSIAEDKFSFVGNFIDGLAATPERIDISINFREYMKLAAKREEALARQLLVPGPDDWVPATIRYKDETYRIDIRLKGDLADHWKREDGWSFKVKVKDNKSLFGLSRFAIQNPRTRNYLSEPPPSQFGDALTD